MLVRTLLVLLLVVRVASAQTPAITEGDFVIRDFRFDSGEVLPALRLHYRTVGTPQRDASGKVRNAVIVMHGTGGTGMGGGRLIEAVDIGVLLPSTADEYGPVEDAFGVIEHLLATWLTMKGGKWMHH